MKILYKLNQKLVKHIEKQQLSSTIVTSYTIKKERILEKTSKRFFNV